jgi:hypothetical protein
MEDLFENQRRCMSDKVILKGRADKKFCNIKCKNDYHNSINRELQKIFKPDEKKLRKNHSVLKMFYELSHGEEFIQIRPLYQEGFYPRYYIGTMKLNATGEIVYLVYDYAFLYDQKLGIKIFYYEGGFYNI